MHGNLPEFMWAVGIEDTFIPQVATTTGRMLDEYELTQHYRYWREDLALAASLGVRTMRYGIPWYRVNPAPGVYDWEWTDEVLEYMVRDLGIHPIVDLMHYGCPLWLQREFVNPEYPERVAEYIGAFVERYRGLTHLYTPLNEPLLNAYFCGHTGNWPPYLRGPRGYVRMIAALAHGMSLSIAAIRDLQPDATVVQAEATMHISTNDPSLEEDVQARWLHQFAPNDLVLGLLDEAHPLRSFLLANGVSPRMLDWFVANPQQIDVVGVNFYPGINVWKMVRREDGVPVAKHACGGVAEFEAVVRRYHERYRKPLMITETSTLGPLWKRERWMDDSLRMVRDLRGEGIPLVGYTWWPLFSLVRWEYRRGRKLVNEYLAHMGLWNLRDDGSGTLLRERTSLADRYAGYVANTSEAIGELGQQPSSRETAAR